jgi:translation initiation factor 4G
MFLQEIENAEIIKRSWFRHLFCWKGSIELKEPEKLNKFISGIMDPFKDKEDDDKIRKKEEEAIEREKELKRAQDEFTRRKKERYDKLEQEREQRKKEMKDKNIVCWPFCYSIPDEKSIEKHRIEKEKTLQDEKVRRLEVENHALRDELEHVIQFSKKEQQQLQTQRQQEQEQEQFQQFSSPARVASSRSQEFHYEEKQREEGMQGIDP